MRPYRPGATIGGFAPNLSIVETVPGDTAREHEDPKHPKIDVSAALGEAGHEVEELGFEGIADTGPLLREAGDGKTPAEDLDDALDAVTMPYPSD